MTLALVADRVFTARSDAAEPGVVIVHGDRIADVAAEVPAGATAIALAGATLLPGFVDAHTHVSIVPSRGNQIDQMKLPLAEQIATARSNVLADLLSGVTTLRVMGQELDVDFWLRDEIARGDTMGPELVCAGVQLAKPGGHGHALSAVTSEEEIARRVEENAAKGAGLIKIFTTGGVSSVATSSSDCPFTAREIRCAADAAHRAGLKLAAHAHGGAGARLALENGVDTIEHAALFDEALIEEAARRQVSIVGTFSILDHPAGIESGDAACPAIVGKVGESRARGAVAWRRILSAGIPIAIGTDSMHGCIAFDIVRLVELGATPARALRAATVDGARVCGLDDRGTIARGQRADLVAVLGDPLLDIRAVGAPVWVMQAGAIVHSVTR